MHEHCSQGGVDKPVNPEITKRSKDPGNIILPYSCKSPMDWDFPISWSATSPIFWEETKSSTANGPLILLSEVSDAKVWVMTLSTYVLLNHALAKIRCDKKPMKPRAPGPPWLLSIGSSGKTQLVPCRNSKGHSVLEEASPMKALKPTCSLLMPLP